MTMNDTTNLLPTNPEEIDAYDLAMDNADLDHLEQMDADEPEDQFMSDAEADADVLASAGMGTDEDYGGGCDRCDEGGDW